VSPEGWEVGRLVIHATAEAQAVKQIEQKKPNIIFIVVDQMRAHALELGVINRSSPRILISWPHRGY